jgi:hypothetical protein
MYRVELKGSYPSVLKVWAGTFLMYRVELKVRRSASASVKVSPLKMFLMYRVELKGYLVMGGA